MSSVETVVLLAVIILMIGVGVRWIRLLNAQHDARSRPTGSANPCRGLPACRTTPLAEPARPSPAPKGTTPT
ncbi:hypothetical protein B6R96_17245 [Streptomyces sp. Sge12]|nr:hypothetical protein B6R96_17245 [Streptomyces sp. Sge12]